ncbi:MAG TPA: carboxypeptidase regulatory-like domain-containing protein [Acidobacteriaceae bacterium]|jgi:hypothetical protein
MPKSGYSRHLLLFASLFLTATIASLHPTAALAQSTSGDVAGTVTDPSGAGIPHATVVATNESTSVSTTVQTNDHGEFRLSNLPPGHYTIKGTAPGFQTFRLQNFMVTLNQTATAQLPLAMAGAATNIEVSAQAAVALDTTTVQLQQTFEAKELQDLPTATTGLGVLNVSLLVPGVGSSGAVGAGTGPSVGGQRPRANNFTIEGIDNNDKSVTGPLVYIPNDAVGEFTLITNQFSPEFGHSAGGQFNTIIKSGTNSMHGRAYEYFQNRNLNAENAIQGGKVPNPRYDFNRYGGEVGGPIKKDKLFYFANFERQETGQTASYFLCTPTAAGLSALNGIANLSAVNLGVYQKYTPPAPSQVDASVDNACFNQTSGPQTLTVYDGAAQQPSGEFGSGNAYAIPLGNYLVAGGYFTNFDALTTAGDWTISPKDSFRARYIYNTEGTTDTAAALPAFFQTLPYRYHLIALSEYHNFTPNLINEARVGFNRYYNITPSGNYTFPGLDSFPTFYIYDQNALAYGPDGNAPQSTIQNLYQFTDNINWVKGNHTLTFGFDGRKFISPQSFTQRVRGDYEWNFLTEYLHDLAPTAFGQRSTGDFFYYGDQSALYAYANDTWRIRPTISLNYGLRYEFTSVPVGERTQALNAAASVPGLIEFREPKPQYLNFAPRVGVAWAPDQKTSVRLGFGMAYDVLYDNLGILSFPPQFSSTHSVGDIGQPQPGDPNFLANGGLPKGTGTLATFASVADQRAATTGYVPDQKLPYAETWSLGVQRVIASNYTAEIRYVGTRGIHLSTQDQINKQPKVDATHFLPTYLQQPSGAELSSLPNTLDEIESRSAIVPAYAAAGFNASITSFQPYSESNYNGLAASLTRRFQNGLLLNFAYTWSKTMDDATADVFSTVLTPRRPQNSQDVAADYSRSALDRTQRLTLEVIYDLPFGKSSGWLMKNVVGNWEVAPIYTYESPEYYTVLSGGDSNLNGDGGGYTDRAIYNVNGVKGTGSPVTGLFDANRASLCGLDDSGNPVTECAANQVAYLATNPSARYITAGAGALANSARNTEPINPINNLDATALKRFNITERYNVEFQAQAFNVLNHAQYIPGYPNIINSVGYTSSLTFQTAGSGGFNQPGKFFTANARTMQLALKFTF